METFVGVSTHSRSLLILIVFVATIGSLPVASESRICDVTCTRGQRCFKEACIPCPDGYFQDTPIHQEPECKPWSYPPPIFNFVVKTPGTRTHDIEWICKEGYGLFQYTPGEFECRLISTTLPTTITVNASRTSETRENTTLSQQIDLNTSENSPVLGSSRPHKKTPLEVWLAPCCGFLILIINSVLIIYFIRRRKRNRTKYIKGNRQTTELRETKYEGKCDHRRRNDENSLNFVFFSSIINQLGPDSEMFIHHLDDPSRKFLAQSSIYFCKESFRPIENAYVHSCLEWVDKNEGNPKLTHYIVKALEEIGRNDFIEGNERLKAETETRCKTDDLIQLDSP